MCERYALPEQLAAEREFVPTQAWWKFTRRLNVAAPQYVPAIRVHDGQSEGVMMRWGLIPSWAEGKVTGEVARCIEADQIERSNQHREPWLASQRCILPVAGFYAWQLTRARYRQPYFVHLLDRSVFGIAGIWDRSVTEDDDVVESCSIVRVSANDLMRQGLKVRSWFFLYSVGVTKSGQEPCQFHRRAFSDVRIFAESIL